MLLSFKGGADSTDGLDVTSTAPGPTFPDGVVIAMNSARRKFLYYRWRDVAAAASPPLTAAGIVDRSTALFSPIGRP